MIRRRGVKTPELLLPRDGLEYGAWAVIACDQFTQDRAYWDAAENVVGDKPSALRIVLPEIDLADAKERIPAIHGAMREYRTSVLTRKIRGAALVRRTTENMVRHGLLAAVDLECYDYLPGSTSLIRATEGTIQERLPPRMEIRRGACLEAPHILLLIDDPEMTVIEPLFARLHRFERLYDFDLMLGGGHIEGWAVTEDNDLRAAGIALDELATDASQRARYGDGWGGHPLLFAVGDGNHSLATAKACWQELKESLSPEEQKEHPARFALVEIGNLHDPGLTFEPIHRVLFGVEGADALASLSRYLQDNKGEGGHQRFEAVYGAVEAAVHTATAPHRLPVGSLQGWIDLYLAEHPLAQVDYIHGEAEARALAAEKDRIAFLLPSIEKSDLFACVLREGALPRKTFSMGEARDKRYYLECREIMPG